MESGHATQMPLNLRMQQVACCAPRAKSQAPPTRCAWVTRRQSLT